MEDAPEDFLILEDEDFSSPEPEIIKPSLLNIRNPLLKKILTKKNYFNPSKKDSSIPDQPIIESISLLSFDGTHEFDWNIRGMDCPDCAMKASKAVKRLSGIEDCYVSATEGRVRVKIDVARGNISQISSLLEKLGHSADVNWLSVTGQKMSDIESRTGLNGTKVTKSLSNIIGILGVRVKSERIELQLLNVSNAEIKTARDKALEQFLGKNYNFSKSTHSNLDKEQLQLIGAIMTIPIIIIVLLMAQIPSMPNWVLLLITLFGISFSSYYMFQEAIASIQNRILGFQVLTSLAVIGAIILNEYPEALMVSGLVALASHLENRALIRARNAMQGGFDRIPKYARILVPRSNNVSLPLSNTPLSKEISLFVNHCNDDDIDLMPIEAVNIGDNIEVRSGEIIPIDGTVIEGNGDIDKAPLTGEPIPVVAKVGDFVEAGLVLKRGPILVKCEAVGDETRLSNLIDLVRKYRDKPTKKHTIIEKFTSVWVPFVLVMAPLIGIYTNSILNTLILWVVSCPCSLLLASPVPHATALSAASKSGLVARGGDVLELAAGIDLALFDKTGTLTSGKSTLKEVFTVRGFDESLAISLASGLEKRSNHPYASSIINELDERSLKASKITYLKDGEAGISGKRDDETVVIGRIDWLVKSGISIPKSINDEVERMRKEGYGISILAVDGKAVAAFSFLHDEAREGVRELINDLQERKIQVEILSGDEQKSVELFAKSIGIPASSCNGGVDPEGKAILVSKKIINHRTLMAGDGFNDAGALAVADIGIAIGSGEQVNLDAADVLIPGQNPHSIIRLIDLAKRTRAIVYLNISISLLITTILVSTVLAGYQINLAAGIALHEASVFLIILNGMWVSGNGISRFSTLLSILNDLKEDIVQSFTILFQSFFRDPPTTS